MENGFICKFFNGKGERTKVNRPSLRLCLISYFRMIVDDLRSIYEYERMKYFSCIFCLGKTFGLVHFFELWDGHVRSLNSSCWRLRVDVLILCPSVSCPLFPSTWLANKREVWIIYEDSFVSGKCEWEKVMELPPKSCLRKNLECYSLLRAAEIFFFCT